jgi:hypothetical protein
MIDIISTDYDLAYFNKIDQYGGKKKYELKFTPDIKEMLTWYKTYRTQLDREIKAREQYPSVAAAYEQYQTILSLVLDQI